MTSPLYRNEVVYDDRRFKKELLGNGKVVMAGGEARLLSRLPPPPGHNPREYSTAFEDAGIDVIPRSEWSARLKEQLEKRERVSDFEAWPALDQNGTPQCHISDTEVLTEKGWTPWPDYNGNDLLATVNVGTGLMEFQECLQLHVNEHDGPMVYSDNRRVDFALTPNHRMLVRKWDEKLRTLSPEFTFQHAGKIGWYAGLPHAPSGIIGTEFQRIGIPDDREYDGDDLIALLSLVSSCGYAGGSENTKNWVSFSCFRESERVKVESLASRVGFHETPSRRGVWIRHDAGALANWVRENGYINPELGAVNKKVPDFIKSASVRQIELFLEWFGDQRHGGKQEIFYSSSRRMIDDLQELHLRVSKRGTITSEECESGQLPDGRTFNRASVRHRLWVSKTNQLCLERKKHLRQDHYKGLVYCATVPNSTLITRRNGTVLISGNCWSNGVAGAAATARVMMGLPYIQLSPASVAIPISGGTSGGYEGDAVRYGKEHGWAPSSLVPQHSTDRRLMSDSKVIESRTKFMLLEVYDLGDSYDKMVTAMLLGWPCAAAFNAWSHVTEICDAVEIESGSFGIRIRNSWSDSFGAKNENGVGGYAVFPEHGAPHGTPSGIFALRQLTVHAGTEYLTA